MISSRAKHAASEAPKCSRWSYEKCASTEAAKAHGDGWVVVWWAGSGASGFGAWMGSVAPRHAMAAGEV